MRVSQFFMDDNDIDNATKYMEKAISFVDDKKRFYPGLIQLFMEAGQNDKAYQTLVQALKESPSDARLNLQAGYYLIEMKKYDEAFMVFENAARLRPQDNDMVEIIYRAILQSNQAEKGIELLERVKQFHSSPKIDKYIIDLRNFGSIE
jgi:Tfp pilus assembly protein PilF